MAKCISCGGFNRYFIYIILSIFFRLFNDILYGFNYNEIFEDVKIFNSTTQDFLSWHSLIHEIFGYIGTIMISIIFYKYEINASKKEGIEHSINSSNSNNKKKLEIHLIHNDAEESISINSDKSSFYICLLVIFLWISSEQLIDIHSLALKDLDFWMLELLILTFYCIKMFKIEIFNHQKCAMWFTLVPCLLKITTIVLSLLFADKEINNTKLRVLYTCKKLYIPIGFLIYIIFISFRSYANTKIKWFMDLKYISPSKLLIYYGVMGSIICTLVSIATTYKECAVDKYNILLFDYICKIQYIDVNHKSKRYFENIKIYIDTLRGKLNTDYKNYDLIYEILIIILGTISFFFHKYFSIKVIQHLTPVYLILSNPIYYMLQKIILLLNNYIIKGYLFIKEILSFEKSRFFLDLSGDIFSIIGFLIYLEIIELNFCNYDYNIKTNITRRSLLESNEISEPEKSMNNSEENQDNEDSIDFTLG